MRPFELHHFANTGQLDPSLIFSANSAARYRVNESGILEAVAANKPRFTFDSNTLRPRGLMCYQAITNLHTNSEVLTNGGGCTVNSNAALAPDGTMTMDELIETTSTSEKYGNDFSYSVISGRYYIYSYYVEALGTGSSRLAVLRCTSGVSTSVFFDLINKTFSTTGGAHISSGYEEFKPGKFRIWVVTLANSSVSSIFRAQMAQSVSTSPYTGDGVSGLRIWGRQLEEYTTAPTRPGPYVQTAGSTVTTAADVLTETIALPEKYSFFADFYAPYYASGVLNAVFNLDDGTSNERIRLGVDSGNLRLLVVDGGSIVYQPTIKSSVVPGRRYKVAGRIEANNIALSVDGEPVFSTSSVALPTVNTLRIGHRETAQNFFNGEICNLAFMRGSLTNTEIQALAR